MRLTARSFGQTTTPSGTRLCLGGVIAIVLCLISRSAVALTPAVLVGPDLEPATVRIQSLHDGVISFFDDQQRFQTQKISHYLQLHNPGVHSHHPGSSSPPNDGAFDLAPGDAAPQADSPASKPPMAMIELVDGQRFAGQLKGTDKRGQTLFWRHSVLGDLSLELEKVRQIRFDATPPPPFEGDSDRIVLSNGDVVRGFVEAVTATHIAIQPENQTQTLEFPIERVRGLTLISQSAAGLVPRHMVFLADGSRLRGDDLILEGGKLRLATQRSGAGGRVDIEFALVSRIDFVSDSGRLVPLTTLPMQVVDGGNVFGSAVKPRVEGTDLILQAPLKMRVTLPRGTKRLAAKAELYTQDDDAANAMAWADFKLQLLDQTAEVLSRHFKQASATATINLPLTGTELMIVLDPAANGPVMDRLRLVDAVVLVGRGP